jgi:deoxyribodipyrimidine photo-lyase
MSPLEHFPPARHEALRRIAAIRPADYARTRNALDGAVTRLSPYLTHGLVDMREVLQGVASAHRLHAQHKLVFELGWRAYFRHVWQHRGEGILHSIHPGPLPDPAYASELPADIRQGRTGVPVIDQAVRELYATGWLHNHARMWLASYVVHVRKVHWRAGADWLYGHLLDGDLASNHLSWQWVAGTGSHKPYLFNAENVAKFAPAPWHSPGTVIDTTYEALDQIARDPSAHRPPSTGLLSTESAEEPALLPTPPDDLAWTPPDARAVAGRDVWLVHPWALGELPADLPPETVVIGIGVADFHQAWPWATHRWHFVQRRMTELCSWRWLADAQSLGQALQGARRVRTVADPHVSPWLSKWAECLEPAGLFPEVHQRRDSFMQWWKVASQGLTFTDDRLAN